MEKLDDAFKGKVDMPAWLAEVLSEGTLKVMKKQGDKQEDGAATLQMSTQKRMFPPRWRNLQSAGREGRATRDSRSLRIRRWRRPQRQGRLPNEREKIRRELLLLREPRVPSPKIRWEGYRKPSAIIFLPRRLRGLGVRGCVKKSDIIIAKDLASIQLY
ncbi:hypothetical protein SOVF_045520 [Spinacia oleracea]|nr:hypothetical protein SOVF_045520 [Spinacia oleracea]